MFLWNVQMHVIILWVKMKASKIFISEKNLLKQGFFQFFISNLCSTQLFRNKIYYAIFANTLLNFVFSKFKYVNINISVLKYARITVIIPETKSFHFKNLTNIK